MTEHQAETIRKLRRQGVGYQTIGNAVGLTRDAVRSYCKNHGLNGIPEIMQLNMQEQAKLGLACANCGFKLKKQNNGRPRRFCCRECREEYWNKHRDELHKSQTAIYTIVCAYCGEVFESYGNRKRKYCCHDHYIKDRFGR